MKGNGWFTGDERDMSMSDTAQYHVPTEDCVFTGVFVGRRGLPVRPNGWHSLECCFRADDGQKIKLYAHRYYWYNKNKKYGCISKWAEDVVYAAWNTDFPIDFAVNVVVGSRWKCEVKMSANGVAAWQRADPISKRKDIEELAASKIYGPHEINYSLLNTE